MTRTLLAIRLVCAVTLASSAAPALAQSDQPSGGPFSGLFSGSPKTQPHTLDVRGALFGAWDDNVYAQAGLPGAVGNEGFFPDPRHLKRGLASGTNGSASYSFSAKGTRSQFSLGANAAFQEFGGTFGTPALWFQSYNALTGLSTNLTNKTSLSVSAGTIYAPYYQYAPFVKDIANEESPVGDDLGFAVQSEWVRSVSANASIENRFSKRSNISAGVGWDRREIPGLDDVSVDSRHARAGFGHNITKRLNIHVGYGLEETRFSGNQDAAPVLNHSLDIGLGYGDSLTLTFGRRYSLSLSVGAGVTKNGNPASVVKTGKSAALNVNGSAILSRSIGREWSASVGYTRGTAYIVGFAEPVQSDSANSGIGGPITRRIHFSAGAGASRMQQVFSSESGSLISYNASAKVSYGIFTHLGMYAQASYYRFSVPAGFITQLGFVPDLDRRSFSVGLSTWYPLIKPRRGKQ